MDELCRTGAGYYDVDGFYHEGPIECVQTDWISNWLIGASIVTIIILLIALFGGMYLHLRQQIRDQKDELERHKFETTSQYNHQSISSQLKKLEEMLGKHDKQISELKRENDDLDGRLTIHYDWIIDLQNQINAILVVFSEFNRLAPRRGAMLTDLLRAVMDQLTPNKNQSGATGEDSNKETTGGSTH
jgi:hypothetical protein